jgi:hypothetical protein
MNHMKRIFLLIVLGGGLITQLSCLTSIHPLVTRDRVVTDNRIVGQWKYGEQQLQIDALPNSSYMRELTKIQGGEKNPQALKGEERADSIFYSKTYILSFRENNVDYYMVAALINIGKSIFLDLYPAAMYDSTNEIGRMYSFNPDYLPVFTMAKLEITGNDKLVIKFIDGNFVRNQINQGKVRIKYEKDNLFDTFLVTASSVELQQFLEKYGNDERLFNEENTIVLTRRGK